MKNKVKKIYKYYQLGYLNKTNIKKIFRLIRAMGIKHAFNKTKQYLGSVRAFEQGGMYSDILNSSFTKYFDIAVMHSLKNKLGDSIVFTTPCLSYGGGELYLLSLAKSIHELNPSLHIFVIVPEFIGTYNPNIHGDYDFITFIACRDFIADDNLEESYNFLKIFISVVKPKILHNINSSITWRLIINESIFLRKNIEKIYACIFCPQYDNLGNLEGFAKEFLQDGIKKVDLLISDNQNFKLFASQNFRLSHDELKKIVTIYTPCKFGKSDSVIAAQNKNLSNIPQKNIKLLWIARLDEQKNVNLLFQIANKYTGFLIYVYGSSIVEGKNKFSNIPKNIILKGIEMDIAKIMLDNDYTAMIMTSRYEGIPTILIIGGYLNIPIIAPDVGGISDLINNDTGYLLSSNPLPVDYKLAVDRIINDHQERFNKINSMHKLIEKRHCFEMMKESLIKLTYLDISKDNVRSLPLVSVIIPCYNQYHFLISCIESVYGAYAGPLDIIVIDDFSTEAKKKTYQNIINNIFPDVRVINNDRNYGVCNTRNIGIDLALGDYIQFLDADDVLLPNKISIQVSQVDEEKNILICDYFLSDDNMELLKYESSIKQFNLTLESFLLFWERGFCIPIHTALFPKAIKENKFDSNLSSREDWIFWISLLINNYKISYLPYQGVIYRMHLDSVTHSKFLIAGKAWIDAVYFILNKIEGEALELKSKFISGATEQYLNYFIPKSIQELSQKSINNEVNIVFDKSTKFNELDELKAKIDFYASTKIFFDKMADITIIIPVYNHFDKLWQCIQSAIDQTCTVKEIIILNDNSSDSMVIDLLYYIENKFSNYIKVINFNKNIGISNIQNHAIEVATGNYILFLDCDDYLELNAVDVMSQILENSSPDYIFTDNYHLMGFDKTYSCYGGYDNIKYSSNENICVDLLYGMVANHLKVIKRSSLLDCGLFNEKYSGVQDWDMALKFCEKGMTFKYIQKPLYNHRIHANSVTNSMRTVQFKLMNLVRRKYLEMRYPHIKSDNSDSEVEIIKESCQLSIIQDCLVHKKQIIFMIDEHTSLNDYWFVNEFNAFFNQIYISHPSQYAILCGYLWDPKIILVK